MEGILICVGLYLFAILFPIFLILVVSVIKNGAVVATKGITEQFSNVRSKISMNWMDEVDKKKRAEAEKLAEVERIKQKAEDEKARQAKLTLLNSQMVQTFYLWDSKVVHKMRDIGEKWGFYPKLLGMLLPGWDNIAIKKSISETHCSWHVQDENNSYGEDADVTWISTDSSVALNLVYNKAGKIVFKVADSEYELSNSGLLNAMKDIYSCGIQTSYNRWV